MKSISFLYVFILLSFQNVFAFTADDRKSIESIVGSYTKSWNENAGKGFADNFTEDADFINIFAEHFKSKTEIENRHIDILSSFLKNSKLTITNIALREIAPNTIVAHVKWIVDGFRTPRTPEGDPGQCRSGIFTHVVVYDGKKWAITASQNTIAP